ncbi:hypothetical protein INR49_012309 [Caranx melampygus]|nr:hypothetical protein INR49_012309 [Caranx melampygus]
MSASIKTDSSHSRHKQKPMQALRQQLSDHSNRPTSLSLDLNLESNQHCAVFEGAMLSWGFQTISVFNNFENTSCTQRQHAQKRAVCRTP